MGCWEDGEVSAIVGQLISVAGKGLTNRRQGRNPRGGYDHPSKYISLTTEEVLRLIQRVGGFILRVQGCQIYQAPAGMFDEAFRCH